MNWRRDLDGGRVLLLDGGTGSELRKRGIALSTSCWSASANLEHADCLTAIHRDYIRAGADIVTTNTFAVTRFVLAAAGLAERFDAVVSAAVGAARRAAADAEREIAVAASLSCLAPGFERAAYPPRDLEYRAYAELAERCAELGADLLLLEMLQDPAHAELACRAAAATGLPWWAGISCRLSANNAPQGGGSSGVRSSLVSFDDPALEFEAMLDTVLRHSPAVVAVMHTPLEAMIPALDKLRSAWPGAIAAYAELPYPEDPAVEVPRSVAPAAYASAAGEWLAHGASILGGCCGTTPAHIAALSDLLAG